MSSRTFLITGASKGIGRAVAEQLAAEGHKVVGIARHAERGDFPGELVALDLSDAGRSAVGLTELAAHYAFDGLVNNVGLVKPQALGTIDLGSFDEVMRVNLHPAILATQALLPGMRARGWGRVVNLAASPAEGARGAAGMGAYMAAKAGVLSLTRTLALEEAAHGITVNAVLPGVIETEGAGPGVRAHPERYAPVGRLGRPEEVARAVVFLCSTDSGYITGAGLPVAGGWGL